MLNRIIEFSVKNKLIVGLFTLILIIYGTIEVTKLPIDALPDITSNQVQVITTSPTLAAPEVERLVTFPVEQSLANVPGIKEMRSISRFGLSVITVVFSDETDFYWARQQVAERLATVREEIPVTAGRPEIAPPTTGLGEIYQYVLRPRKGYESLYDLTELRSIQDWVVRRQLLGTPGVADVSSFGGYLKEYEVAVFPDRLKSMGITVSDVFTALENNNQNSGGAYIEKGPTALFIRTEGLAKNLEEIGSIVISYRENGMPIVIRDVADVRIGHAVRYGAMTYKDKGEVAGAVVLMLKGANASEVVDAVKQRIEEIRQTLPEGVVLETFYDRTKMVDRAIKTVKTNLLEGALIVVFILVLFLGNLRAGLVVASVIPLSMLFAVIMMNIFGVSGNLMSLGALDFGLIVDGAVIIVEAVLHRLTHKKIMAGNASLSQQEMDGEVKTAAGKMMNSAVFGQIIILIVYLPILTLVGIEGKMFKPMAQTVSFALIGAFILSLTYVPMITSLVMSKKTKYKKNISDRMMKRIQTLYQPVLSKALQFPRLVIGGVVSLFILAIFILNSLGGEFIPELEEGDFAVDARMMTGSSLSESIKTSTKAASILQSRFPEVDMIVTRIGASEIPTDPMPIEMTDIIINLKPKEEWTSATSFDELADKMGTALSDIPGLSFGFQFPVQMRFNELISGARQDVVCKIFGENLDSLSTYAHRLGALVNAVEGATDVYVEAVTGLPQIEINYNRQAMASHQLNIATVNQLIRTAFAGESAGQVFENERRYDLVLRLNENLRNDISDVSELLIPTPRGVQVPLEQVADVRIVEGWNQVQREDAKRRIIVGFNVRGRDVETVVKDLRQKVSDGIKFPPGYYINYGGQFQNLVEAKQRLYIAVPVSLLLILVLLYFAFGSIKYGLLIFSAIPFSAIGGVIALWIRDMPFSISAGIGFIALFGVAVLNGIVLIAEFNRLKKDGMKDLNQVISEGTHIRLRPVIMTAAVASLGFLPMALSQGAGAEVQRPLATVVIGGLITATFLTLIVLPVLYRWMESRGKTKSRVNPALLIGGLILYCPIASSQVPVDTLTLDQVLLKAREQNLSLKATSNQVLYWQALQKGVFDPGKTTAGIEYGQINTSFKDTRLSVAQAFDLPVVYARRKELFLANENVQKEIVKWKSSELDREVKKIFYQLIDLEEREKLLNRLDTLFARFRLAANLKWEAGESNLLEKTSADIQWEQLNLQKQQLRMDRLIFQRQLQWLMNTAQVVLPQYDDLKLKLETGDTASIQQHPFIQYHQKQQEAAAAEVMIEKSALSPNFSIEYNNQSFIGYHSPDGISQEYYKGSRRFHTVGVGVGIPIFNKAVRARVQAARINEHAAKMNVYVMHQEMVMNWQKWINELNKHKRSVDYFEQSGLRQADLILNNGMLASREGDIDYLEWIMLMSNAINIHLGYLDAIKQYNLAAIELAYLNEN